MDVGAEDNILRKAAGYGSIEYSTWPALLPSVVSRIEKIVHSEFPIPRLPPTRPPFRPPSPRFLAPLPSSDPIEPSDPSDTASPSRGTNKENANPTPPVLGTSNTATEGPSQPAPVPMLPPLQPPVEPGMLPPPIATLLDEIISTLTTNFARYPPHTLQRFSELILYPKQHYRSLAAYLNALDRIVHVTSGADTYPLPPAVMGVSAVFNVGNGVGANGETGAAAHSLAADAIGSDEALGGALLTPIPWLARRMNSDEDGTGSESGSCSPVSGVDLGQDGGLARDAQEQPQQQQQGSGHTLPTGGRQLEGQVRTESTETIDGPNGIGSIETVSVSVNGIPSTGAGGGGTPLVSRGVTQGELLRQEQRAGVVPVSQYSRHGYAGTTASGNAASSGATVSHAGPAARADSADEDAPMVDDHETPHARGPDEIGAADMGPQKEAGGSYAARSGVEMQGIDVERAVGRRAGHDDRPPPHDDHAGDGPAAAVPQSPKHKAEEAIDGAASKKLKEDSDTDTPAVAGSGAAQPPPEKDAEGDTVIGGTEPRLPATAGSASGPADDPESKSEATVADAGKEAITDRGLSG